VLFTANGFFQGLLLSDSTPHHLQLDRVTAAGMASGAVMALVNCPVELLKVRLQIQDHSRESQRYRGLLDCARQTVKADGPWGLYRGFGATLLRDLPSFAAYFATYEAVKAQFPSTSSPAALIISGGMAGIAAWLPCYPQDVLKSRIQSAASPSTSLLQAVSALSREAGMRGFWKGFGPTMLRAFPANAATFLGYEFAMRHLDSLKVIEA
jgi:solute carrier family 25 carnitine/acylcarnitine transporter 20/29